MDDKNIEKRLKKYDWQISCLKYTLYCILIICMAIGLSVLALSIWMLSDSDFQDWVQKLEVPQFYIGIYILLIIGLVIIFVSAFGWAGAFAEGPGKLKVFAGLEAFCFVCLVAGSGVLLAYSTRNSEIQPLMRKTMRRLIMESDNPKSVDTLRIIQETIGCCGADGASDYIALKKPLPTECRDTVTGNAFFYGCVEEFTSFLESKSAWLAGLALVLGLLQVVNLVMAIILAKIIENKKYSVSTPFKSAHRMFRQPGQTDSEIDERTNLQD